MLTAFSMGLFVLDMGRFLLINEYIAERARQTVRQAAVHNWSTNQVKNYLVYNVASAEASETPGRLGLLPSQVTYASLGTTGSPNHRLQVRVAGVRAFLFIPYLSGSFTLPTVVATAPAESMGIVQ